MATIFETEKAEWSNKAHFSAQDTLYPLLFNCRKEDLTFESTTISDGGERNRLLDGSLGIDRIAKIECGLNSTINYTIQERFREKKFSNYRDVTITEWNHSTNMPSELYKIAALLFLYAYWDEKSGFGEAVLLDTFKVLELVRTKQVKIKSQLNRKNQSFICVSFDELKKHNGVVLHHYNPFNSL